MRKCRKDWLREENYCKEREEYKLEDCTDCCFNETKREFDEWYAQAYGGKTKDIKNIILDLPEYYDKGLGEVVKSRSHRRQLMKEKKVEEVGNEWKYVDPVRERQIRDRQHEREWESINAVAHRMLQNSDN